MTILIDTSLLLAIGAPQDINHKRAVKWVQENEEILVIPASVLPELFFMCVTRIHYDTAIKMFELLQTEDYITAALTASDYQRMSQIMRQYRSASFDFVDCAIMALSERLKITRVATFDHRDFSIFRPQHYAALELIPSE